MFKSQMVWQTYIKINSSCLTLDSNSQTHNSNSYLFLLIFTSVFLQYAAAIIGFSGFTAMYSLIPTREDEELILFYTFLMHSILPLSFNITMQVFLSTVIFFIFQKVIFVSQLFSL